MADEVLTRVPLGLNVPRIGKGKPQEDEGPLFMAIETDDQVDGGDLSDVVKELNATCYEYGRENARRIICSVRETSGKTNCVTYDVLCCLDRSSTVVGTQKIWSCCIIL